MRSCSGDDPLLLAHPSPILRVNHWDDRLLAELGLPPFSPRFPWWGPDLQTLRDSFRSPPAPSGQARAIPFPIEAGAALLGMLDPPPLHPPRALVVILHGLGGSGDSPGPLRLSRALRLEGFSALRLNLRGAGAGRALAPGSYAADCSGDLLPVLHQLRRLAADLGPARTPLPLVGVGLSLGGTVLLNAIRRGLQQGEPALDALVCLSSPLDLEGCSRQFDRVRNHLYRRWLVRRLRDQVLADPEPLSPTQRRALTGSGRPTTISGFDALITVPRWGYQSLEHYYRDASPVHWLGSTGDLPPTLLLHAVDDPWVPVAPLERLLESGGIAPPAGFEICLAPGGGHNGFHAVGDIPDGSWSDRFTARWLGRRLCAG